MSNKFELTFLSKTELENCFEAFAEMDKFITYHPNAFKYDKIDINKFRIYEKAFSLAPTNTFILEINSNYNEKWVKYDASLFGFIKIKILLNFIELNQNSDTTNSYKTKILETVDLNFGFPIKQFLRFAFNLFHSQMINNIDNKNSK